MAYQPPLNGRRINIKADSNPAIDNDTVTLASGTNISLGQAGSTITIDGSIADGSVTNAKLDDMAQSTIKGRASGAGTGAPTDLSQTQVTTILNSGASAPPSITTSGAVGTAASLARSDHTHSLASDVVTNTILANMATQTFKGRNTAGTGNPEDLSVSTAQTMLGISDIDNAWSTWSPTLSNLTLGNGTLKARYKQVGKIVFFDFRFICGSTSSVGSGPSFTMPVSMHSTTYTVPTYGIGTGALLNAATAVRACYGSMESTLGTIRIDAYDTSGQGALVTASSPWSWGNLDALHLWGTYEAA